MDAFVIQGGRPLRGSVRIHGSKNAALPLMAASLLTDQPVTLHDVPDLADIRNMLRLLESLGVSIMRGRTPGPPPAQPKPAAAAAAPKTPDAEYAGPYQGLNELNKSAKPKAPPATAPKPSSERSEGPDQAQDQTTGGALNLHATDPTKSLAHYEIVRTMRAGICVLGPLLGARGEAKVSMPGGCAIGDRPVDLHLRGLRALGAQITLEAGYIHATAPGHVPGTDRARRGRLQGAHVFLGGPMGSTVLGTANVMSAAVLAEGTTIIESAACEPEVVDLADLLIAMGAKISGAGSPTIVIEGVDELLGAEHVIIPDRIEAGTYVAAAAITAGDVTLENFPTGMLTAFLDRLRIVGITLEPTPKPNAERSEASDASGAAHAPHQRHTVRVVSQRRLAPVHIVTQPHPGFPTDLQAQVMALLTLADGNSIITEKIFPDRFMHVPELLRMNANITRTGTSAIITGSRELVGAPVMASDLRASAGLVIAGLAARGTTTVNRVYHLDRGYEKMERTLQNLGANIQRLDDKDL
jgi:UDP-N-acetylglucosamine 1-carboxyvinyltransferase